MKSFFRVKTFKFPKRNITPINYYILSVFVFVFLYTRRIMIKYLKHFPLPSPQHIYLCLYNSYVSIHRIVVISEAFCIPVKIDFFSPSNFCTLSSTRRTAVGIHTCAGTTTPLNKFNFCPTFPRRPINEKLFARSVVCHVIIIFKK